MAPENFIVRKDNKAVKDFIVNKKSIEQGRHLAWYNKNSKHTFEVEHLTGSTNLLADLLSRNCYAEEN